MKDRIEFRFTVATGKLDAGWLKFLKPIAKQIEDKLERIAEAATKVIEAEAEENITKNKGE